MNKWILVMDSGIGGLWTLNCLQKEMPHENFLFFMDKINAPYGNKRPCKLKKIVCNSIKKLRNLYDIKMIVLACNTISSVCFESITMQNSDLPIIKIQPHINVKEFKNKPTLVLVTNNTAKHSSAISTISNQQNIYIHSFGTLAKNIDDAYGNFDALLPILQQELSVYKLYDIKNIVLGCTHYNYIKPQLKKIFGKVKFFENSKKVAEECRQLIDFQNLQRDEEDGRTIVICKI